MDTCMYSTCTYVVYVYIELLYRCGIIPIKSLDNENFKTQHMRQLTGGSITLSGTKQSFFQEMYYFPKTLTS